jgi:hypothetical protein
VSCFLLVISGSVLDGDGYVIRISCPVDHSGKKVVNAAEYNNRKTTYAMIAQVFSDHVGRVRIVAVKHPGNTHDRVCMQDLAFYRYLRDVGLDDQWHINMDEAYDGLVPDIFATPWPKRTLSTVLRGIMSREQYLRKRGYNLLHATERSTAERTFGMMVSRFRILKCGFDCHHRRVATIFEAICRLHNLCVDDLISHSTAVRFAVPLADRPSGCPAVTDPVYAAFDRQQRAVARFRGGRLLQAGASELDEDERLLQLVRATEAFDLHSYDRDLGGLPNRAAMRRNYTNNDDGDDPTGDVGPPTQQGQRTDLLLRSRLTERIWREGYRYQGFDAP